MWSEIRSSNGTGKERREKKSKFIASWNCRIYYTSQHFETVDILSSWRESIGRYNVAAADEKLEFDIPTHKHFFPYEWRMNLPMNSTAELELEPIDSNNTECNMQRKVHIFFKFQISPSKKIHFSGSLFSCTYFKICFFCSFSFCESQPYINALNELFTFSTAMARVE